MQLKHLLNFFVHFTECDMGFMELDVFKNAVPSAKRHVTVTMSLVTARMAVKVVGKEMIVWRVMDYSGDLII